METKSILAAVVIIVVSAAVSVEGRTDVSDSISTDTIWDVNGSPYVLIADVDVNSGATLLIEQAVEVNSQDSVYTLSASGRLIARDANVNDVNITATAGGSLDLLGCSVIGGTVTVDAGAAARVKYSSLSSLSLDSNSYTCVTGNDFSGGTVTTSGDSSATINIEANWWGGIEPNGIDPGYFADIQSKIIDHNDDVNLPYADFSPYLGQLPPQDSNDDGAIGDLLGQVFIKLTEEAEPYMGAVVTVDIPNQLFRLTDSEGKFAFSGIPVGETTISVAKSPLSVVPSFFYNMSEKVLVGENSETFVYMRVTSKLPQPPSAGFATTSSNGYPPSVVEIRSKHFGPYRHTYYLDGISLQQTVTATVDWRSEAISEEKREVRWYRDANKFHTTDVSDGNQVTYESHTFDIDDELDAYTQLKVQAWSQSMESSAIKTANLDVIVPPPGVPPILLNPDTSQSVIFYRIVGSDFWAFEALMKGVGAVGSVIPCLSGSPYELAAKAYASAQVRGDGTASVVFLDGYELPSIKAGDVEITPSVSLELGWEYISDYWDPWGELGLGAEGCYTTPPSYTIVLVGPVPVPVYWRLEMGMGFDQGFDLDNWTADEPPIPDWDLLEAQNEFIFKLWLELMLGVGIADVAAVEGYFGGGAEMHMDHDVELQALYIKLYGGLRVVVWIFKYEKKAIYYKWKMPVGESSGSSIIRMDMNSGGSGELAVFTRSYLERPNYARNILDVNDLTQYLSDMNMTLFDLGEEKPLQHNVFPYSQPAIAADGNDLLLVWVYDDPSRDPNVPNSLNRTRIMFSRYDGDWSEPNYVDSNDDQSPDFSPQLAVMGPNQALCVWEDSDSNLADANLDDMAAAMGISAAYYNNGNWEQSTSLSGVNSQLDRSPRLAAGTSKAMAVWISNSENNIGIDPNANTEPNNNTIHCRIWEDPNWGALETVGTGIGVIGKTALAMSGDGSKAIYVYELDSDADLGTDTDRELYAFSYSDDNWSDDPCRLTYNEVLADTNPQVVYKNDNSIFLAWNCNGYIVSYDGLDVSTLQNDTLALANVTGVGKVALPVDVHADGRVDFLDFAVLANQWLYDDCAADNNWCEYCDFDQSGRVDSNDLRIFFDFWLPPLVGSAGARDFCLAKASDDRISVVWPERAADGNGIDVFTATYLPSLSAWSFPYPLTFDESLERFLAATYVESSGTKQLALAYNEVAFDFNEVSISPDDDPDDSNWLEPMIIPEPNRVDLYTLTHQLRHDLRITPGDISFEPRNPLPGSTVKITAVVHNTGDFAEENVPVFFYRENPFNPLELLTIQETNIPGLILPGGQGIITIPWRVPEIVFGPQQIYIITDPCNLIKEDSKDGSDPNDNEANTSVMAPDLAVSMINAKEIDPKRGLTARIKNSGGVRVDGARVIICRGDDGEPNYSDVDAEFDISLDPNAFYDIRYMWTPDSANDTTLYVVADPNDANNPNGAIDEFDEENNIGFGLIRLE